MIQDPVFAAFLQAQVAAARELAARTDRLRLLPVDGPVPTAYLARFFCRGLVRSAAGEIEEHGEWVVGIRFPEDYLRAAVRVPEVLTFLGPPNVFHPNLRPPFVCLHIRCGTSLNELVHALWELLTWSVYGIGDDGLNREAAQYARRQPPGRFPIDRRPLLLPRA